MNNKRIVKILNNLVAYHIDRITGYEIGVKETDEQDLKSMFSHFILVSQKIKAELSDEIRKLGGIPTAVVRERENFLPCWKEVMRALGSKNPLEILVCCERSENVILDAYRKVLSDYEDEIPSDHQMATMQSQIRLLKVNLNEIRDARGLLAVS